MANRKMKKLCVEIMKSYGASNEMITRFKSVFDFYRHVPVEDEVITEFINLCREYNFFDWYTSIQGHPKHFYRKGDPFPETAIEEICYRRGYIHGMLEMGRLLGKELDPETEKKYDEWRNAPFFTLEGAPPAKAAFDLDDICAYLKNHP